MAHSNRKKLRASRGGLTKNQLRKTQTGGSSAQSSRLQETINWLNRLEESKKVKTPTSTTSKVIKFAKDTRTIQRRSKALTRLENQLSKNEKNILGLKPEFLLSEQSIKRIKKEISTLKSRI